ncbi:hypothetical protein [Streptomyces pulveraceus]|uniref:Uncharacterized protein n=1 Tax=Streptomyces pulveraceus TaxID=68258 RepID=A0ABW1GCS2_9ACTN
MAVDARGELRDHPSLLMTPLPGGVEADDAGAQERIRLAARQAADIHRARVTGAAHVQNLLEQFDRQNCLDGPEGRSVAAESARIERRTTPPLRCRSGGPAKRQHGAYTRYSALSRVVVSDDPKGNSRRILRASARPPAHTRKASHTR